MNGRTAKALRREAKAATQGAPERAYLERKHSRNKKVPKRNKLGDVVKDANGKPVMIEVRITATEQRLDPTSTKGYYRQLKRKKG